MAAKKDEERDETPTRLKHVNGAVGTVPAYKANGLVATGLFSKAPAKRAASKSE